MGHIEQRTADSTAAEFRAVQRQSIAPNQKYADNADCRLCESKNSISGHSLRKARALRGTDECVRPYTSDFGRFSPKYFITICKSFHASPFWRGSRRRNAGW